MSRSQGESGDISADPVDWHSRIAADFASAYVRSARFRERKTIWTALIKKYLPLGGQVLDAGCGPGLLSEIAAPIAATVVAFDASSEMLVLAGKRLAEFGGKIQLSLARLEDTQRFGRDRFDIILCSSVLEYIANQDKAVEALRIALKVGGVLVCSVPNSRSLYRRCEHQIHRLTGRPRYMDYSQWNWSNSEFRSALKQHGLKILEERTCGSAPLIGALMRKLGVGRFADTLLVAAAVREL